MEEKACILGVSGSGKTCYICAMSHILGKPNSTNFRLSIRNEQIDDDELSISEMAREMINPDSPTWPKGTKKTRDIIFKVKRDNPAKDLIDQLCIRDFKGGILRNRQNEHRINFLKEFKESHSIIFLIDAKTILNLINPIDLDSTHRNDYGKDSMVVYDAEEELKCIDNILQEFIDYNQSSKPVLVTITKSDMFANEHEKNCAKQLVKDYLSSVFAVGTKAEAGICFVALGEDLDSEARQDGKSDIIGKLQFRDADCTHLNLHIPMMFALYNYLDSIYDGQREENKRVFEEVWASIRVMFKDKLEMYINGEHAFAIES